MKMSKNILIKGRPTTVRELFETGLLEGYPVFYNGGKKGFPLRGTIKDAGIICSCSLCKGVTVVPPCKFEIHACKSYRRASQYICLENGKSLLDIVKECCKAPVKALEETIQNFIGPLPLKESFICHNCKKTFLAPSSAKVGPLCDSCMTIVNSDAVAECVISGPSEAVLGATVSENIEVHDTPQNESYQERKKRKPLELASDSKYSRSSPPISTKKGKWETTNMRSRSSRASKSRVSGSVGYTSSMSDVNTNGGASTHGSLKNKSSGRLLNKDQRMHRLVFEDGGLPDGTEVAYYSHGKKLRDGYKMGSGIVCRCCNTKISPSQFEAHAGWAARRKPYMYIYTSNGVSLHEFAISLLKGRNGSAKNNDDLCIICADGGKLVLCDGCPRAFHKECASLSCIPRGRWYCTYCQNMFQRERFVEYNANAVAAGRVLGIDAIEQIKSRCIRTVRSPDEAELIACVICRGYDFSKSGFGPRTVILCDQECFDPIVDSETGRDFIPSMVYGSTVVSVGILRIFGQDMAELPLAATRVGSQDRGYFQILFTCIEKLLAFLGVKLFVLPAADEAKSIWTNKFGFTTISEEQKNKFRNVVSLTKIYQIPCPPAGAKKHSRSSSIFTVESEKETNPEKAICLVGKRQT
ncbi:hypothetical protein F511_06353 [Dorcoceras hygrometricum]|uniref:PHD-type domain-containing protein n=1 Tax=Dorcoceras hygrometricum TaxID=472368 RepID=A0A2Z7AXS2_9LAMI|nr:hypothetical protein F511_06353 [Dorcoceras hygrometricum]